MSLVTLTIDNRIVAVAPGATILEAAKKLGIKIPTLCTWPEIGHTPGACRISPLFLTKDSMIFIPEEVRRPSIFMIL